MDKAIASTPKPDEAENKASTSHIQRLGEEQEIQSLDEIGEVEEISEIRERLDDVTKLDTDDIEFLPTAYKRDPITGKGVEVKPFKLDKAKDDEDDATAA